MNHFQAFPVFPWLQCLIPVPQRSPVVIPILLLLSQLQLQVLKFLIFAYANHMQNQDFYLRFLRLALFRREDHHKSYRQVLSHLFLHQLVPVQQGIRVIIKNQILRMSGPLHVAIFIYCLNEISTGLAF